MSSSCSPQSDQEYPADHRNIHTIVPLNRICASKPINPTVDASNSYSISYLPTGAKDASLEDSRGLPLCQSLRCTICFPTVPYIPYVGPEVDDDTENFYDVTWEDYPPHRIPTYHPIVHWTLLATVKQVRSFPGGIRIQAADKTDHLVMIVLHKDPRVHLPDVEDFIVGNVLALRYAHCVPSDSVANFGTLKNDDVVVSVTAEDMPYFSVLRVTMHDLFVTVKERKTVDEFHCSNCRKPNPTVECTECMTEQYCSVNCLVSHSVKHFPSCLGYYYLRCITMPTMNMHSYERPIPFNRMMY